MICYRHQLLSYSPSGSRKALRSVSGYPQNILLPGLLVSRILHSEQPELQMAAEVWNSPTSARLSHTLLNAHRTADLGHVKLLWQLNICRYIPKRFSGCLNLAASGLQCRLIIRSNFGQQRFVRLVLMPSGEVLDAARQGVTTRTCSEA